MNQWEVAVEAGTFDPSTAIGGPPDASLIATLSLIILGLMLILFFFSEIYRRSDTT